MNQELHQHFSMIRNFHLADLFTLGNGFCGVSAIFSAMKFLTTEQPYYILWAGVLVICAAVFDLLDGRVARWRHKASSMGRELDSLADVISFGVAPACIAYAIGLNTVLDQIILLYFSGCGLSRLARYNITAEALSAQTGKVQYFEGTPITTSFIPLGLLMVAFYYDNFFPIQLPVGHIHLVSLLFLISGSLMISKTLHIPKP